MVEAYQFSTDGIDACQVGALAEIAPVARQRQVVGFVGTAVLFGDNVFDVMRQCTMLLGEQTVFTTILCPSPDEIVGRGIHG